MTHAAREAQLLADAVTSPISFDGAQLRKVKLGELAIRFAFGFGVSIVAGLVTLTFGNHVGGLFLAFPAILPASLTLIGEKDGEEQAQLSAAGAVVGAVGMVAFAATAFLLFDSMHPAAAEGVALLSWAGVSVGLYLIARRLVRRLPR